MKIELKEFGVNLGSRQVGAEIRQDIQTALEGGEAVEIDFSDVELATPSFVDELIGVLFIGYTPEELRGRLKVTGASPEVQALIRRVIAGRVQSSTSMAAPTSKESDVMPSMPSQAPSGTTEPGSFDPFAVLRQVQNDYLSYVRTFQRFQNPEIGQWVLDHIENGSLLWKPPYVQVSRPFAMGEPLEDLVAQDRLQPGVLHVFRRNAEDPVSPPILPFAHQSDAVHRILSGKNVIVATGTGSGKSFAFGIPIVSDALRQRSLGVRGIQAVIIYPMNALANSQYDEFARRLHGSGLRIALYTGDTAWSPDQALQRYRQSTGREQPYDSEVLSRQEIQQNPPDILMTNYVMLELLLTRFEDRTLFAHKGVLRFLVLDEVHTYSGKRGADVAALIRRLKQHGLRLDSSEHLP